MNAINAALEFIDRAYTLKDSSWMLMVMMVGTACLMVWYWIHHWPFRIVSVPVIALAAVIGNTLLADHGLNASSDALFNNAVGFGAGIVVAITVLCSSAWLYYEMAAD